MRVEPKPLTPERWAEIEELVEVLPVTGVVYALREMLAESAYWRQKADEAEQRNRRSICVYCGEVQTLSDPAKLREEMAIHIVQCPKHPMNRIVEVMTAAEAFIERTAGCSLCFEARAALELAISILGEKRST